MGHIWGRVEAALLGQRGHLFSWVPVCLGLGIGLYFMLRFEPPVVALMVGAVAGCVTLTLGPRLGAVAGPMITALALVFLGLSLAGARAHWVRGPVLDFRYYGPIEGRIVGIDRSASDAVRLTLDRVVLERLAPADTPTRVRVSLHGQQGYITPEPGATIFLSGHLSAPAGAVEPYGFDFRRHAWFLRLGAIGYTRSPVLLLAPPERSLPVFAARMALSGRVQQGIAGESGAFAAAVMTGDRSGMGQGTLNDLRATNLAHLLAISGLHMGLLAGVVFGALRLGLLLTPGIGLRWPVKKLAAFGALIAAAGYLALSGGNVATERAFVMASVGLIAIMLDRRVISLRAVAMAALVVLFLRPESLLGPGFQMSFAATTALVAVFSVLRNLPDERRLPSWLSPIAAVALSSAVAGLATAPIGMAHFNQISHYGLVANLLSVPIMGLVVMPSAVIAVVLMPLGLDWIGLALMSLGVDWILAVTHRIADWDGAVGQIAAPAPVVLPILALGALWVMLWRGYLRWLGTVPVALSLLLWAQSERPYILIADDGGLVGVMTDAGRALSRAKGGGFLARTWLENDGDAGDQLTASARWKGEVSGGIARTPLESGQLIHVSGKRAAATVTSCQPKDIIVTTHPLDALAGCDVLDPEILTRTGAMAVIRTADGLRFVSSAATTGHRLWHAARSKGSPKVAFLYQ
ncbi:ComEC/Rec2 family competence protein [Puniceibacterium sp. IMCC21224]|uniref:ComEC/Rec2 family competence protein n=1 Tax=Puniceibacterium sp. IMCC21224 TaxID=1618204 RepID=UPI00064D9753|nr:ComEC/Rec2 family competence protein [Puniceibacterium sp. IMCC21224]KMK67178.1 ComEC/Rec2-related protein [Puniceibacterium sp. IMCC21224]